MSQRFEKRFAELEQTKEGAFVPFVTLCDPDFDTSLEILKTLIKAGADALELGFPFSDPCADGPVIQKADKRAILSGAKTEDFFTLIARVREFDKDIPISILVYSNLVIARGIDRFYADSAKAGIDAVLIADIPVGMMHTCDDFVKCACAHDIDNVMIAPPNADETTLKAIAEISRGYTYVLSRFGITGTDNEFGRPVGVIRRLYELHAAKPLLGFGISTPEHVKMALETGVAGAIAGSGVVKLVEKNLDDKATMLKDIYDYVEKMKAATRLKRNALFG